MLGREFVQDADDLVLHEAQPLGAAAAVPVLQQQLLGRGAALRSARPSDAAATAGAQFALGAGMIFGQALELGRDALGVEDFGRKAAPGRLGSAWLPSR